MVLSRYDHEHPSSCLRLLQKYKTTTTPNKSFRRRLHSIIEEVSKQHLRKMSLLTGKIITSDIQFAGTDAGVTIWLYDKDGRESGANPIVHPPDEDIMERGDVDTFR